MSKFKVDLNCDVGEGVDNEAFLIPNISSCNIACGGHAGDTETMQTVVKLCKEYNVKAGAHPSFPDRENFGRKDMSMPHDDLVKSVKSQIEDLIVVLNENKVPLYHIKPHGALYDMAAKNETIAKAIIEVMQDYKEIHLYVPYNSVMERLAITAGLSIIYEGFADRNYNEDLRLVSRALPNALIIDEEEMFEHVYRMVTQEKVKTASGVEVKIKAQTFCVHGDNPKAIELIAALKTNLTKSGIEIT
ncbi:5-oxoprolinase subunit PxpA [Flavobacteriaceae bacterium AU392]|nr:5-oxoprolinase subunit PxpA [Flavobacteriaceae bacterium]RKM85397.1 5-oxoprolinase subunit PxpA [Flavobacteriaceae bacterium AU392]